MWNCLWGNALKRSPGIIRKIRVLYPGPGFLSSATWPSLPKKHYSGLNLVILNNECSVYLVHLLDHNPDLYHPDCDPDNFAPFKRGISGARTLELFH